MPANICTLKIHPLMTKTKSWKSTAAVKLFDFEFSKLRMWGTSKISQKKNSPFSVKHGSLKKSRHGPQRRLR